MNASGLGKNRLNPVAAAAMVAVIMTAGMLVFFAETSSETDADTYVKDVTKNGTTYDDDQGIKYTLVSSYTYVDYRVGSGTSFTKTGTYAKITGYTHANGQDELVFPSSIRVGNITYTVIGVLDDSSYWGTGKYFENNVQVTGLKVYVDCPGYWLSSDLFKNNTNLRSLEIIYNEDNADAICSIGSSAFDKCSNLGTIILPAQINSVGITVFANCLALEELMFDTSVKKFETAAGMVGYMFTGCTNLHVLTIGKNVDRLPDTLFSERKDVQSGTDANKYKGCSALDVVYNAGAKVTQDKVESSVRASGSYHVLIFNLCGGDLDTPAEIRGTSGNVMTVAMPSAKITNSSGSDVSIPSWTDKDQSKYYSLSEASITFGSSGDDRIFHTLYGNCTVDYYYGGELIATQDVTCEYATPLLSGVDGYSVVSWNTAENGSGDSYICGQTVTLVSDLVLYAQIVENGHDITITYSATSGTWTKKTYTATASAKSGQPVVMMGSDEFKTKSRPATGSAYSSTVYYWCTESNGNGKYYEVGANAVFDEDITLYAITTRNPSVTLITLTYHSNNGDNETSKEYKFSLKSTTSVNHVVEGLIFSYEEHIFLGWSTSSLDTTVRYLPGDIITVSTSSSTIDLYAVWRSTTDMGQGTIKYYRNVDSVSSVPDYVQDITLGSPSLKLDPVNFVWAGHTLIGWSKEPDATFSSFTLEMNVYLTESIELYAVWSVSETPGTVLAVANSGMILHDGSSHDVFRGVTVFGLAPGLELTVTDYYVVECNGVVDDSGSVREVSDIGVYRYEIVCMITDASGEDVTDSYDLVCYSGTLTIIRGGSSSSVVC